MPSAHDVEVVRLQNKVSRVVVVVILPPLSELGMGLNVAIPYPPIKVVMATILLKKTRHDSQGALNLKYYHSKVTKYLIGRESQSNI